MKKLLLILLFACLPAAAQKINLSTNVRGTLPCANMPALTGSITSSAGSCVTSGGGGGSNPVIDCSQSAGAEDGAKLQACLVTLAGRNAINGIADARGMTGGSWAVNPFAASSLPASGRILLPPGTINVLYGPVLVPQAWSLEGISTRNADGFQGSVLKAGTLFPVTYSTGTVTVGTPNGPDVIVGNVTAWANNYSTHTGTDIAPGCAFVAPAGGNTANSTFGVIRTITDATHITLGWGINNGTGAPAGSTYTIYCPVGQFGDGGVSGGDMYGMSAVNMGFDANSKAGVIPLMSWYGEQGTFVDTVSLRNYCGIGFDLENEYQNSGPWNRMIVSSSTTCAASSTMNVVVRGAAQNFYGITNLTLGSVSQTRQVDIEGDYVLLDGVDSEMTSGIGIDIGASATCNPACARPGAYSAGNIIRNAYGHGTTLIHQSSTNGGDSNSFQNLASTGTGFTNLLIDSNSGCTHTVAQAPRLTRYETGQGGAITSSSSVSSTCQASPTLAALSVAGLTTATGGVTVPSGATLTIASGATLTCAGGSTCPSGGSGGGANGTMLQIGLQRGSNLAPAFGSSYTESNWAEGAGSMAINITGANSFSPTSALAIVSGQTYQVDLVVSAYTSGTFTVSLGGVTTPAVTPAASNQYRFYITATSTANLSVSAASSGAQQMTFSSASVKRAGYDATSSANFSVIVDTNSGLSTPLTVYQPIATPGWQFQEYVIATQPIVVKTANGTDTWAWGTSSFTGTLTFSAVRQTFLSQICYVSGFWDIAGLNGSITPA